MYPNAMCPTTEMDRAELDGTTTIGRELALAWLARALQSVVRQLHSTSTDDAAVVLLSVAATSGRDATVLPSLLRFMTDDDRRVTLDRPLLRVHSVTGGVDALVVSDASLADVVRGASVVLVCVETLEAEHDTWADLPRRLEQLRSSAPLAAAWILVSFSCARALSVTVSVHDASSCSSAIDVDRLETAVQPLHDLQRQCGLSLTLDLLAKLSMPAHPLPSPTASSLWASPVATQLPFQLLLMLLRWSSFHPRVVALLSTPFLRKLALVPQQRVRDEIHALYATHARLWHDLYAHDTAYVQWTLPQRSSPPRHHLTLPPEAADDDLDGALPPLQRLSQCALWNKQKQFYRDQGIRAWSNHLIPFGVSSSSYLAMQYARLAVDFLRQSCLVCTSTSATPTSCSSSTPRQRVPNCFVWEAASGSCKFLHTFLLHFYALVAHDRLEERFGIVPCVVASDLSEQVLESREEMACFQPYIASNRLDFAAFDTDTFLRSDCDDERGVLRLRHSGMRWRVAQEHGPVFIIGNYFFDSLRTDVFVVTQHEAAGPIEVREARIDPTTDHIPDMLFSLTTLPLHPRDAPVYSDAATNAALVATLDRLETQWAAMPSAPSSTAATGGSDVVNSSLILFPVEAIEFLNAVLYRPNELSGFPVAVVTGDATFSFRDAVPISFIDEDTGDLEIPQLSPHPDCFCLPVDLEILKVAVLSARRAGGSASIVSTPSSDTFNVFFAQSPHLSERSRQQLTHRFQDVFDQFTPCDCDLLWGLMSVDDGAKHLSTTSQLALLAQTAWDFDVFTAVQWQLLHNWKTRRSASELEDDDSFHVERERRHLMEAGRRSVQTFYVMDETAPALTVALTKLQMARWLYELHAFADARQVLDSIRFENFDHRGLLVASTYLYGLAAYHMNDWWAALASFRKGQQLEPNRLRLKKWVARTLIRLQEAVQQNNTRAR